MIGDLGHPWKTVNAAITAAIAASSLSNGFTVHVFKGDYAETSVVAPFADCNISIYFEAGAYLSVATTSPGIWLTSEDSTVSIAGAGRSLCGITVNEGTVIWSYNSISPGQTTLGDQSFLKINNITIASSTVNGEAVIEGGWVTIEIDNSTIVNLQTRANSVGYVLKYTYSQVSVRNSLLESLSRYQLVDLGPTFNISTISASSWIIAETNSLEGGTSTQARLRLHNVSLSAHGANGNSSNFIVTNTPTDDNRILLDGVYFYSNSGSPYCYSLVNISSTDVATYYAAGTVISCGSIPTANSGLNWMGYPASVTSSSLVQWNLKDILSPRPY